MSTRSLLLWGVLAVGAGLWVGVNYPDTEADAWIKGGLGVLMIVAGGFIALAADSDRRIAQLQGSGLALFGVAQVIPAPWSLAASLVGLALMVAAIMRRRRLRHAARPTA